MRPAEVGQTFGPSPGLVGASGSTATPGVPVEDRWMRRGGSATVPKVLMEGKDSTAAPHELMGAGGSAATPEASTERGGSVAMPFEIREMSPPAREQGAGSKRSSRDKSGQGSGVHPQNVLTAQRRQSRPLTPLFFPLFYFSVLSLCLFPSCRFL